jgi:hypothetical protein
MSADGTVTGSGEFNSACVLGCALRGEGSWYYEVELQSEGVMQLGWADNLFEGDSTNGDGVGDDTHSWAYDGVRQQAWNGKEKDYGDQWATGDVVGCSLTIGSAGKAKGKGKAADAVLVATISYSINGRDLGAAFEQVPVPEGAGGFYPAYSLEEEEQLVINVGQYPFKFPPASLAASPAALGASSSSSSSSSCSSSSSSSVAEVLAVHDAMGAAMKEACSLSAHQAHERRREQIKVHMQPPPPPQQVQEGLENAAPSTTAPISAASAKVAPAPAPAPKLKPKPTPKPPPVKPAELDLKPYSSAEALHKLGLDRLKAALMFLGVKCGGTLEERASRLFSVKGIAKDRIDQKLLAKGGNKRKK